MENLKIGMAVQILFGTIGIITKIIESDTGNRSVFIKNYKYLNLVDGVHIIEEGYGVTTLREHELSKLAKIKVEIV